ncbi:MAG: hypothetical protein K2X35_16575 [Bryobacteraceae bacterium]|nr:hypothetical protein [Bryobacteraceae bacterium]
MYSYTPGGLTTKKRFRVERSPGGNGDLDGVWTYDSEGKMTSVAIPKSSTYSYGYDSMGRVYSMNRDGEGPVVNGIGYGPAGELMTMVKGGALYENRTYNDRLQLRTLQVGTRNITYNYGAGGTNNGQIVSQVEDGETIAYQYDELKRLASASATGAMTWTQSYNYDGFGNLVSMGASGNGGGGGPTAGSQVINPATNKPFSGYSAAGLPNFGGWDNDNRMVTAFGPGSNPEYLVYSPSGKRVWNQGVRLVDPFTQETVQEVWFWSPQGQRLAFYSLSNTGAPVFTFQSANLYMGGKLINQPTDRLGSVGKFYPYGAERNPTGQSGEKFATYFHDANVGLYYADQRWHLGTRFATPDPYQASGGPADPGSWNRYAYVGGDPGNRVDPAGLFFCEVGTQFLGQQGQMEWWCYNYVPTVALCPPGLLNLGGVCSPAIDVPAIDPQLVSIGGLRQVGAISGWQRELDGYTLSFRSAEALKIALPICIAQPQLCAVVGGAIAIYVTYPVLEQIIRDLIALYQQKPTTITIEDDLCMEILQADLRACRQAPIPSLTCFEKAYLNYDRCLKKLPRV